MRKRGKCCRKGKNLSTRDWKCGQLKRGKGNKKEKKREKKRGKKEGKKGKKRGKKGRKVGERVLGNTLKH